MAGIALLKGDVGRGHVLRCPRHRDKRLGKPSCTNVNPTTTVCQNPGNTQISTSPGTVATPYWGWPFGGGGLIISIGGGR
jgi:hypothetical protein